MKYDLVIIGGGPAGYSAALRASSLGLRTGLVERKALGGTCLNQGCVPTKLFAHTAELFQQARTSLHHGITADGVSVNWTAVQARKADIVGKLRSGIEQLLHQHKIDVIIGNAYIPHAGTVAIGDTVIHTDNILIATGSKPMVPVVDGAITTNELLELTALPRSLAIIGGGVIAVEFAHIFNSLGVDVTMHLRSDRILRQWDKEISQSLSQSFNRRGIKIVKNCNIDQIPAISEGIMLSATGRIPDHEGLFSADLNIDFVKGIITDQCGRTNIAGIFAAGDVTENSPQLAHVAMEQGERVADFISGMSIGAIPVIVSCIYTSPEIASVGLTVSKAKADGVSVVTAKYAMAANARTLIATTHRGFIKLIAEKGTLRIIGAQLMCERASDIVSELALAINAGMTAYDLAHSLRPHPTFTEGISEAAKSLLEKTE
jgi:dihydrolipoamide dehydrogenase